MDNFTSLPQLDFEEIRVLGSLIEKSRTTPEYYPLTINALQTACNQKTSRKPIVSFDENTIINTLDSLKKKGLISTVVGGGSRVTKYKHNMGIQFPLVPQQLAALCLLFLRGPLTAGEINTNAGRLYEFESIEDVQEVLNTLQETENPYIKLLAKKTGQKESRYIHLFGEFDEEQYDLLTNNTTNANNSNSHVSELENRVTLLESQLAELREQFDKLLAELT